MSQKAELAFAPQDTIGIYTGIESPLFFDGIDIFLNRNDKDEIVPPMIKHLIGLKLPEDDAVLLAENVLDMLEDLISDTTVIGARNANETS